MPRTKQPVSAFSKVNTVQDKKVLNTVQTIFKRYEWQTSLGEFAVVDFVDCIAGTDDMYDEQAEDSENPLRCPIKLYDYYLFKWWVTLIDIKMDNLSPFPHIVQSEANEPWDPATVILLWKLNLQPECVE